jgi:hypothetical protein
VALCLHCHAQTDAPGARGRLVITPLAYGRFAAEVTRGADKSAIRDPSQHTIPITTSIGTDLTV